MRLTELMFQGVLGQSSTVRLPCPDDFSRPELPLDISTEGVQGLLVGLLYPEECEPEERRRLQEATDPRVAAAVVHKERTFRIARGGAPASLQVHLRRDGEFQAVAKGVPDVPELLRKKLGRPPLPVFRALNFWQFGRGTREALESTVDPEEIGPEAVEMLNDYEETLEIDRVEGRIEEIDDEIRTLKSGFENAFDVESRLEEARSRRSELTVPDLSDDEWEMLDEREERLDDYRQQLESLAEDEEYEREQVEALQPTPPWRERPMWFGILAATLAVGISLARPNYLRWLALFDVAGFGVVAWTCLRYLTDREQVNIHKVRVESIKRRTVELRREMAEFQEKVDHLLIHEDAETPGELVERRRRARELDQKIERLEQRADELADDPEFQEARDRMEELREERRELQERREELPEFGADLFELENRLNALGIDPEAAIRARGHGRGDADSPFIVLRAVARELDCWEEGGLEEKVLGIWRKMAGHVFGDAAADLALAADGELAGAASLVDRSSESWRRDHPNRVRALAATLALALELRTRESARHFETVLVEEPGTEIPAAIARPLLEVLRESSKRVHVVVPGRGR